MIGLHSPRHIWLVLISGTETKTAGYALEAAETDFSRFGRAHAACVMDRCGVVHMCGPGLFMFLQFGDDV